MLWGEGVKVYNKSVDMIAWFQKDSAIRPMRFKLTQDDGEEITIKVNRLINRTTEKVAATIYENFKCQSVINNVERVYELRYDQKNFKWILYKM